MRNPTRHIVFSPHCDDAIACCGGTIAQALAAGDLVTVFTLFCGPVALPFSPVAETLHKIWSAPEDVVRLRRAEDEAASARLGASLLFGDTPEAIYRRDPEGVWLYEQLSGIFDKRRPEDDRLVAELVEEIQSRVSLSWARLYFPLGIGCHVDHLIMFEVGQVFAREGHDVVFYEDFPYAAKRADYQRRLEALPDFRSFTTKLSEHDILAKIDAFSYYRSQILMLFDNYSNMPVQFIEYAKSVGRPDYPFGERFWFDSRIGNPDRERSGLCRRV
jgi:LmbE family N-acetylglucosaminyl deacetylase